MAKLPHAAEILALLRLDDPLQRPVLKLIHDDAVHAPGIFEQTADEVHGFDIALDFPEQDVAPLGGRRPLQRNRESPTVSLFGAGSDSLIKRESEDADQDTRRHN